MCEESVNPIVDFFKKKGDFNSKEGKDLLMQKSCFMQEAAEDPLLRKALRKLLNEGEPVPTLAGTISTVISSYNGK